MRKILMLLMLMVGLVVHASTTDYNVRDFGAKGDGKTLDHHAINAAIGSCVAHGGGRAELAMREYREQGKNYPEAKFAKETPAYGLFARHVDGLEVNNVTFRTMKPEYRPAAMLVDVKNESITNLKADLQKGAKLIVKKK